MEIDEGVDFVVDDRETGTQTKTITHKRVFADELTVIRFYDAC